MQLDSGIQRTQWRSLKKKINGRAGLKNNTVQKIILKLATSLEATSH
jgi:hypothetical protein